MTEKKRLKYYYVFNDKGYSIGSHCEKCVSKSVHDQRIIEKETTIQLMDNKKKNLNCVWCGKKSPATNPKARRLIKELDDLHNDPKYERMKVKWEAIYKEKKHDKDWKERKDKLYKKISDYLTVAARREAEINHYLYPEDTYFKKQMKEYAEKDKKKLLTE